MRTLSTPNLFCAATLALGVLAAACHHAAPPAAAVADATDQRITYPTAKTVEHWDDYHGIRVQDPYRWLENTKSRDTRRWIEAQNTLTETFIGDQDQARAQIRDRLQTLWNFERIGVPEAHGERLFFSQNSGLQDQDVFYVLDPQSATPRVLLDPNTLSDDGTIAVRHYVPSPDGTLLAYGISEGGSDWVEWRVRRVDDGVDLPDRVFWSKFSSVAWTHDSTGFFYSRYDAPKSGDELEGQNYFQKLYFHRLGAKQRQDTLVHQRPDEKTWGFGPYVTEDGNYLVVTVWKGTENKYRILVKDLRQQKSSLQVLIPDFDAEYAIVGSHNDTLYFRTNLNAPRGRVVAIDVKRSDRKEWREIIPEGPHTLEGVSYVGGKLFATYLKDAHSDVRIHTIDGKLQHTLSLPGIGTAYGFGGQAKSSETFYGFTSFTAPPRIFRYNIAKQKSALFRQPKTAFNPNNYVTRQIFYTSKDGTRVPMFISHRRDLDTTKAHPTYLYGYGGFNIPITPSFRVENLAWMEMGGVFAVANLRGGGEYGRAWHKAGTREQKQNVFDDFIAAAEWLIQEGLTTSDLLAIGGRSNGGLLIGACMTQRPDLFAAAIPQVGVLDMLRFDQFTIGWAWTDDYGSPQDPEDFEVLRSYSPLHNIETGTHYPATLVTTADHDDRVVPAHSFKFTAALQQAQAGTAPILIRIDTRAGHGSGTPISKQIDEIADRWTFLLKTLDGSLKPHVPTQELTLSPHSSSPQPRPQTASVQSPDAGSR